MFDVSVMTAVGVALLVAILMLMSCASTLLCKLTDLLKAPTSPVCLVLKNPSMVARDTITASTYATSGCYPKVQNCEECDLCADSENLPPCFCDVNEGL
ncbi:protein FAM24A [Molossus nigricans]|uniref:Family with sequence similarity 24 member B n=1 Tax=Molossus molossus TaxID=27622 RepID=A0A7J8DP19_MOLMO|nr:protein FAM24A [Molossus molossus]KAF6424881.1 family with sequence similarity 24 member B [Molossus molossus]